MPSVIPSGYTFRDGTGYFKDDDNTGPYSIDAAGLPHLIGGDSASKYHLVSAASTNAAPVKTSPGRVLGWQFQNTNAAVRYVKLHNVAVSPTAGVAVFMSIGIPANGKSEVFLPGGIGFSTGIGITAVTGAADSDTTGVGANDIVGTLLYA
jgi:hypothetical protein